MKNSFYALSVATLAVALLSPGSAHAVLSVTNAFDDGNSSGYTPQPFNNWSTVNGGSGFNNWTILGGVSGGGTFMSNTRQVTGANSFGLYAGNGANSGFALSRALTTGVAVGEFDARIRFDVPGTGLDLISIRAGNDTSAFGAGELFSFGIVGALDVSQLGFTDGSGLHLLNSGEARGSIWDLSLAFNATLGTYTATIFNAGGGFATNFSGNLSMSGTNMGSFAVINSSSGDNNNVIFGNTTVSSSPVPEPTTVALLTLSGALLLYKIRRRK